MNATHIANKAQQESASELSIQKLEDQTSAESAKMNLLEKEAENASIASSGQAIADAKAKAESLLIKSNKLYLNPISNNVF
jgi:major vault protein